jgi:HlyD family secretion protein
MDRQLKKRKWPPKKIAGLAIISIFVFLILYTFIFGDRSSKLNVKKERITISEVTKGPFKEFIPVIGTVLPIETVYLDAEEGGRVEKKFIEAGIFIEQGQEILQLGNTNLLLSIMFREAEFFEQSNNLRNTRLLMEQSRLNLKSQLVNFEYQTLKLKRQYERQKELASKNLISNEEFENTKDEYEYHLKSKSLAIETYKQDSLFRHVQIEQLEGNIARMQSNLKVVKQKLESLTIDAPISGHLTSLYAEIGESKQPGDRIGQIDVLDSFKVRVGIDEHYIARIEKDKFGTFDFSDKSYQLSIHRVYLEVIDGKFEVDMVFTGKTPEGIRRGQTFHIRLDLSDLTEAILLPVGGFYQKTGGRWVYILDKSGDFAIKKNIRINRSNSEMYEIVSGLAPGDRVITSSYDNFGDKDKLILK